MQIHEIIAANSIILFTDHCALIDRPKLHFIRESLLLSSLLKFGNFRFPKSKTCNLIPKQLLLLFPIFSFSNSQPNCTFSRDRTASLFQCPYSEWLETFELKAILSILVYRLTRLSGVFMIAMYLLTFSAHVVFAR